MAFETGDSLQPKKGGPALSVVKIDDGLVYCGIMDSGEKNSKAFRAEELTLYKEEGGFRRLLIQAAAGAAAGSRRRPQRVTQPDT